MLNDLKDQVGHWDFCSKIKLSVQNWNK